MDRLIVLLNEPITGFVAGGFARSPKSRLATSGQQGVVERLRSDEE
jgi:hypothetical protein